VPLLDVSRAREELGWEPRHRADDALLELLEGLREGAGGADAAPRPLDGRRGAAGASSRASARE
jgi:UDP-glucose 4-epimerase